MLDEDLNGRAKIDRVIGKVSNQEVRERVKLWALPIIHENTSHRKKRSGIEMLNDGQYPLDRIVGRVLQIIVEPNGFPNPFFQLEK